MKKGKYKFVIEANFISIFFSQIIVLWTSDTPIPHKKRWPLIDVPLVIVRPETKV